VTTLDNKAATDMINKQDEEAQMKQGCKTQLRVRIQILSSVLIHSSFDVSLLL